jgi:hypothetical protein
MCGTSGHGIRLLNDDQADQDDQVIRMIKSAGEGILRRRRRFRADQAGLRRSSYQLMRRVTNITNARIRNSAIEPASSA